MSSQSLIKSIKNSVNVITGCGSGLGRSTLEWFLKNGSGPTLAIDRHISQDFLDSLELNAEEESKLIVKCQNTFDEGETDKNLKEFSSQYGPIHNLVNVAGVSLAFTMYWQNSGAIYQSDHVRSQIKFNTYGTFNMIRLGAKYMIDNSINSNQTNIIPKCIINTSSVATTSPCIGQTFYAASNGAIDSMTLCLARELAPFNIRCNTINVGYFDTKLVRSSDKMVSQFIGEVSLAPRRVGRGEEFAHLVSTIIENQMINGACIKLDAGIRSLM